MSKRQREPAPVEVSAAELARLAGFSKMQVSKWGPMGLSKLGRVVLQGTQKRILYRRDEALEWIKANATGLPVGRGGKRVGSGRKKGAKGGRGIGHRASGIGPKPVPSAPAAAGPVPTGTPAPAQPTPRRLVPPRPASDTQQAAAAAPADQAEADWHSLKPAEKIERLLSMSPEQKVVFLCSLTAVETKQFLDAQKYLSEELARAEKERTLISVDEAKEVWTDICSTAANQLEGKRETIAVRLLTELGLPSSAKARIRTIIEQEHAEFITTLRGCAYAGGSV